MAGAMQPASPLLRVTLAGGLAIFVADDPRPATLPAGKAVTLLALLLARRGRLVPTDTIVEALWAESPPAKAEQNVASLVSRLRRIVGRNRIVGTGRGYLWRGDPDCRVDLDEAARLLEEADADLAAGDASLASVAAGRALELVGRGEVLADQPQAAWVDDARRDGARLLRRVRECAWTAALALGQPQRGLDLAHERNADNLFYPAVGWRAGGGASHLRAPSRAGGRGTRRRPSSRDGPVAPGDPAGRAGLSLSGTTSHLPPVRRWPGWPTERIRKPAVGLGSGRHRPRRTGARGWGRWGRQEPAGHGAGRSGGIDRRDGRPCPLLRGRTLALRAAAPGGGQILHCRTAPRVGAPARRRLERHLGRAHALARTAARAGRVPTCWPRA